MGKQELIDRAVNDLKGKIPNGEPEIAYLGYFVENGMLRKNWVGSICVVGEFTKRARELGWINGFKWGVDTNTLQKGTSVQFPSGQGVLVVADPDSNGVVIVQDDRGEYRRVAADTIKLIKTEREKFIEEMSVIIHRWQIEDNISAMKCAEALLESGKFKLIEEEQL